MAVVVVAVIAVDGGSQMVVRSVVMPAVCMLSLVDIQARPLGIRAEVGIGNTSAARSVPSVFPVEGMHGCVSGPIRTC